MIKTIKEYIKPFAKDEKEALVELRAVIHSVSNFDETIAYGMPSIKYKGKFVAGFRMYRNHIGFYPFSGSTLGNFASELQGFKTSPGAVQLPKGKALPQALIKKIIRARMREIDSKA